MVVPWVELGEQVLLFVAFENEFLVLVEEEVVVIRWLRVSVVVEGFCWRRRSWMSVGSVRGWTRRVPQIVLAFVVAVCCGVVWMHHGR